MPLEPGTTITSDNPEIEELGLEGIQSEIKRMESEQKGGQPTNPSAKPDNGQTALPGQKPAQEKSEAPKPDAFEELKKQFQQFGGSLSEFKQQLNRVSALQARLDKLEKEKNAPPSNQNPEEAAILAAQEKYVEDLIAKKYGLTPDISQFIAQDMEERKIRNTADNFTGEARALAGEDYEKLEPYAVKLINEHWDKAIAGDPVSRAILNNPGNLIWHAQKLFAANSIEQNKEVIQTRTRAVEKPTLRAGSSPTPARGKFTREDLDDLDVEDLPELTKQVNEMVGKR